MSFTSSSSDWISAYKAGNPLSSDSSSADIVIHDGSSPFTLDLTRARGGDSLNPFISTSNTPDPSSSYSSGSEGSEGEGEGAASELYAGLDIKKLRASTIAHGTLLGLAFVIVYPLGAILVRVLSFKGAVWVHAGTQVFAYALALAGLGLGVYIGVTPEYEVRLCHPFFSLPPPFFFSFFSLPLWLMEKVCLAAHLHPCKPQIFSNFFFLPAIVG